MEAYQNIIRHRAPPVQGGARSLLLLNVGGEADRVLSLNPVSPDDVERLDDALKEVSRSDTAQLKDRFLARLRDGARTERGGAGLGLIEMARRSGGGLRHHWLRMEEGRRSLLLQACWGGSEQALLHPDQAAGIQADVLALDAVMVVRCGRSPSSDGATLRIMEREAAVPEALALAFHAAMEWLAEEAGDGPRALLLLGTAGKQRLVLAMSGKPEAMDAVLARVRRATAMGSPALEAQLRAALLGRRRDEHLSAALLELARAAGDSADTATFGEGRWLLWAVPVGDRR